MEKDNYQPSGKVKTRLKTLRDDFMDEESPLRKTLSALRKGKDYGIQIARAYNKIAENTGIPSVPPLVLNALEKL